MGIFGWSYPPGAENDPLAPYNQEDPICGVDPDEAYSIGVEVDGGSDEVYFTAEQCEDDGKWYASGMVDSDTGHFVDDLFTDDGPYDSYEEACWAALHKAFEWCIEQGMDQAELDKQHDALFDAIHLDNCMIKKPKPKGE